MHRQTAVRGALPIELRGLVANKLPADLFACPRCGQLALRIVGRRDLDRLNPQTREPTWVWNVACGHCGLHHEIREDIPRPKIDVYNRLVDDLAAVPPV